MSKVYIPAPSAVWPSDPLGALVLKLIGFCWFMGCAAAFLSVLGD